MQDTFIAPPPKTPSLSPHRTKLILVAGSVFLIIPFPWDWVPLLGDIVDVAGFLVASYVLRNGAGPSGGSK